MCTVTSNRSHVYRNNVLVYRLNVVDSVKSSVVVVSNSSYSPSAAFAELPHHSLTPSCLDVSQSYHLPVALPTISRSRPTADLHYILKLERSQNDSLPLPKQQQTLLTEGFKVRKRKKFPTEDRIKTLVVEVKHETKPPPSDHKAPQQNNDTPQIHYQ
eukprot:IDg23160t1